MVCPNCKHELNPLARVCPTCGAPVAGATGVPVAVVAPAGQEPAPKKLGVTAARVFTILFCLLAVALNAILIWAWFLPTVAVKSPSATDPSSLTLRSMFELCHHAAPWLTFTMIGLCVLNCVFCLLPLFKRFANKRCRMLIPKLLTTAVTGCYAAPFVRTDIVPGISRRIVGPEVHANLFTGVCLALFVLLCVIAGLTSRNRYLVQHRRVDALREQLTALGVTPDA